MIESWTPNLCHGGAEWHVRTRRRLIWPSLGTRDIYKNTITNHLYNGNNAQICNAYQGEVFPTDMTEIVVHGPRVLGKIICPLYGGSRGHLRLFQFADVTLVGRATHGIK